ncbi:hypothetical protein PSTG_05240 [Puccinia striiformis f. sp. tritici PST-78]|uniref:Uncharacterized protein n=1 Tax=Puccinia striiformis f. sp. tritici PST-78 TaxID=1165861 RepID=A0A0L0VQJ3_9BASI|nr:hypothetical protein PSTG_05240 [Puccinia striiformis f. sp. tritici PST-78]
MACASSTAPVLQALRALARRFKQMRFDVRHGEKKEELTEDELAQKNKLLDELQSSLLPSIKQQLNTLSAVLDLPRGFREFPQPDVDLTLETLTNLNQTMKKSSINIRLATLETSVPTDTHDHHLGRCKTFRGRLLREDIARIEYNLYGLYLTYMKRVESWNHTTLLANLTNDHKDNDSILARRVIQLAPLIVPGIKLLTTFYNKISITNTKKLQFKLDTEINSQTLFQLHGDPDSILFRCEVLVGQLGYGHDANSMTLASGHMREAINNASGFVDSTVVLLDLYHIPLSSEIDHLSLESDFKTWLFEWHGLWHTAKNRLLDALSIPVDEN